MEQLPVRLMALMLILSLGYPLSAGSPKVVKKTRPHQKSIKEPKASEKMGFVRLSFNQLVEMKYLDRVAYLEHLGAVISKLEIIQNRFGFTKYAKHERVPKRVDFWKYLLGEEALALEAPRDIASEKFKMGRNQGDRCIYGANLQKYSGKSGRGGCRKPKCDGGRKGVKCGFLMTGLSGKQACFVGGVVDSLAGGSVKACTRNNNFSYKPSRSTKGCYQQKAILKCVNKDRVKKTLDAHSTWLAKASSPSLKDIEVEIKQLKKYAYDERVMAHLLGMTQKYRDHQANKRKKLPESVSGISKDFKQFGRGIESLFSGYRKHCESQVDKSVLEDIRKTANSTGASPTQNIARQHLGKMKVIESAYKASKKNSKVRYAVKDIFQQEECKLAEMAEAELFNTRVNIDIFAQYKRVEAPKSALGPMMTPFRRNQRESLRSSKADIDAEKVFTPPHIPWVRRGVASSGKRMPASEGYEEIILRPREPIKGIGAPKLGENGSGLNPTPEAKLKPKKNGVKILGCDGSFEGNEKKYELGADSMSCIFCLLNDHIKRSHLYSDPNVRPSKAWLALLSVMAHSCGEANAKPSNNALTVAKALNLVQTYGICSSKDYSFSGSKKITRREDVNKWQSGKVPVQEATNDRFEEVFGKSHEDMKDLFCEEGNISGNLSMSLDLSARRNFGKNTEGWGWNYDANPDDQEDRLVNCIVKAKKFAKAHYGDPVTGGMCTRVFLAEAHQRRAYDSGRYGREITGALTRELDQEHTIASTHPNSSAFSGSGIIMASRKNKDSGTEACYLGKTVTYLDGEPQKLSFTKVNKKTSGLPASQNYNPLEWDFKKQNFTDGVGMGQNKYLSFTMRDHEHCSIMAGSTGAPSPSGSSKSAK